MTPDALDPAPLRPVRVALAVRDLAGTARFYREVIGLSALPDPGQTTRNGARVLLGAGGAALLELVHRPDARPEPAGAAGLFHTAVLLPSRAWLGRWLAHASALGVSLDGAADHLVSEAAYLRDPEGNGVEVYADRPRGDWQWEAGRVRMASLPLDAAGLRAAADGGAWTGAPAGARLGHVHLRVGDAARAARFATAVLGLDLVADWSGAAFLSSGGYHHHLGVNHWHSAGAGPRDPAAAGLLDVTLEAEPARLAAILARAARHGGAPDATPASRPDEGAAPIPGDTVLRDPWGTRLRLVPRPTEGSPS